MKGTVIPWARSERNSIFTPGQYIADPVAEMSLAEYAFWMWRVDEIQIDYAYDVTVPDSPPQIESGTVITRKRSSAPGLIATEFDVLRATWPEATGDWALGPGYLGITDPDIGGAIDVDFHWPLSYFGVIRPPIAPRYRIKTYFDALMMGGQLGTYLAADPVFSAGIYCTIQGGTDPVTGDVYPDIVKPFFKLSSADVVNSGFMTITPSSFYRWSSTSGPTYSATTGRLVEG